MRTSIIKSTLLALATLAVPIRCGSRSVRPQTGVSPHLAYTSQNFADSLATIRSAGARRPLIAKFWTARAVCTP